MNTQLRCSQEAQESTYSEGMTVLFLHFSLTLFLKAWGNLNVTYLAMTSLCPLGTSQIRSFTTLILILHREPYHLMGT